MTAPAEFMGPAELRVLGALIEKAITTPDYYPLTLNALTNACNQTSNRDPVVAFDEADVVRALDALRERRLAFLFTGADSRVPKYGHKFGDERELAPDEVAVLCELMLRGPQTVGEIRSRASRMHPFATLAEAEATLAALAAKLPAPLVVKLPRQMGLKEGRYSHLLGGPLAAEAAEPLPRLEPATLAGRSENERIAKLEAEASELRREIADLKQQFAAFRQQFD
jgi:uncharacterized protein YceH (UPF0502 family)